MVKLLQWATAVLMATHRSEGSGLGAAQVDCVVPDIPFGNGAAFNTFFNTFMGDVTAVAFTTTMSELINLELDRTNVGVGETISPTTTIWITCDGSGAVADPVAGPARAGANPPANPSAGREVGTSYKFPTVPWVSCADNNKWNPVVSKAGDDRTWVVDRHWTTAIGSSTARVGVQRANRGTGNGPRPEAEDPGSFDVSWISCHSCPFPGTDSLEAQFGSRLHCQCDIGYTGPGLNWILRAGSTTVQRSDTDQFSYDRYSSDDGLDGYYMAGECFPAACNIAGSNHMAGASCACSRGYRGTITWRAAVAADGAGSAAVPAAWTGSCVAVPCPDKARQLETTTRIPELTAMSYAGTFDTMGQMTSITVDNCECNRYHTGSIDWIVSATESNQDWESSCTAAACPDNAAGTECTCDTGYTGSPTWTENTPGSGVWGGTCTASACPSNALADGSTGCTCVSGYTGNVTWSPGEWNLACPRTECMSWFDGAWNGTCVAVPAGSCGRRRRRA